MVDVGEDRDGVMLPTGSRLLRCWCIDGNHSSAIASLS